MSDVPLPWSYRVSPTASQTATGSPRTDGIRLSSGEQLLLTIARRHGVAAPLQRFLARAPVPPDASALAGGAERLAGLLGGHGSLLRAAAQAPLRADLAEVAGAATSKRKLLTWITQVVLRIEHPLLSFEARLAGVEPVLCISWPVGIGALEAEAHLAAGLALAVTRGAGSATSPSRLMASGVAGLVLRMGAPDRPPRRSPPGGAAVAESVRALVAEVAAWRAAESRFIRALEACTASLLREQEVTRTPAAFVVSLITFAGARCATLRVLEDGVERTAAAAGDGGGLETVVELHDGTSLWGTLEVAGGDAPAVAGILAPLLAPALQEGTTVPSLRERLGSLGDAAIAVALATARGRSAKEISAQQGKSVGWVRKQLASVYRKLGIRSKAELAGVHSRAARQLPKAQPSPFCVSLEPAAVDPLDIELAAEPRAADVLVARSAAHAARSRGRAAARDLVAAAARSNDVATLSEEVGAIIRRGAGEVSATSRPYAQQPMLGEFRPDAPEGPYLIALEELVRWAADRLAQVNEPPEVSSLTPRQRQVYQCRRRGLSNAHIQAKLAISRTAVAKHLRVLRELGLA